MSLLAVVRAIAKQGLFFLGGGCPQTLFIQSQYELNILY